jgi:hypothetical protein
LANILSFYLIFKHERVIVFIRYIMQKIFNALVWLSATTLVLISAMLFYSSWFELPQQNSVIQQTQDTQTAIAARNTKEGEVQGLKSEMELEDARAEIVANFLEKYDSPLKPYDYYGQMLVDIADKYDLDFRFLPAVMMEESNLCKNIPENSYNCLGFGIHSKGTLGFESYEAGFERAAKELRANYVEEGRILISEIAKKYTASVDKWTDSVNQWMTEMKYDDRAKGIKNKADSNVLEFVK